MQAPSRSYSQPCCRDRRRRACTALSSLQTPVQTPKALCPRCNPTQTHVGALQAAVHHRAERQRAGAVRALIPDAGRCAVLIPEQHPHLHRWRIQSGVVGSAPTAYAPRQRQRCCKARCASSVDVHREPATCRLQASRRRLQVHPHAASHAPSSTQPQAAVPSSRLQKAQRAPCGPPPGWR